MSDPREQSGQLKPARKTKCQREEFNPTDAHPEHRESLESLKDSTHESKLYSCDQCEYAATTSSSLKRHKESKHEGIRYPCDQCEYTATTAGNLKEHKKSKHEGITYPCDQCEYFATTAGSLIVHKVHLESFWALKLDIFMSIQSHLFAK